MAQRIAATTGSFTNAIFKLGVVTCSSTAALGVVYYFAWYRPRKEKFEGFLKACTTDESLIKAQTERLQRMGYHPGSYTLSADKFKGLFENCDGKEFLEAMTQFYTLQGMKEEGATADREAYLKARNQTRVRQFQALDPFPADLSTMESLERKYRSHVPTDKASIDSFVERMEKFKNGESDEFSFALARLNNIPRPKLSEAAVDEGLKRIKAGEERAKVILETARAAVEAEGAI
ncbi:uncharacterized protein LOC127861447 [Dreissena polymorpha]|uniref:Uncharacterized protein n=1 Tax=Dreissena polymorpha TaxID=45954 RepID=A0A9D4BI99_DREPO|nr:uncharacterized protein LOC127861447 [Dreissena polymorpha]KAH3696610.1 hypothetical protein DPMN_084086 [Dreissena polymorpha]